MNIFNGSLWNSILQILSNPVFGLIFCVVLVILVARAVRRVIKVIIGLGVLVAFVWLVTHNKSFADICIAIVSAVFNILLVLIVVIAIFIVITIIFVFIMFVISKPSPHRSRKRFSSRNSPLPSRIDGGINLSDEEVMIRAALAKGHISTKQAMALLREKGQRIASLMQDFTRMFEHLEGEFNRNSWFETLICIMHFYFSGLSVHMVQIKKFHQICNSEITDLASILPAIFADVDVQMLEDMARAKTFLPAKDDWQDFIDNQSLFPSLSSYILLRLLCLHRDWKEAGTILYKCYCYVTQLNEYIEALVTAQEGERGSP